MFVGSLTMTYFRAVYPALSSALRRFTVLFGMGRRGANALWSSEKTVARQAEPAPRHAYRSTTLEEVKRGSVMDFYQALVKLRKGLAVIGSSHTGN